MGKASNRSNIERLLQRSRAQEERNHALRQLVAAQTHLINAAKSNARVEALRRRQATDTSMKELALDLALTVEEQHLQQRNKGDELQDRIVGYLEEQHQQQRIVDLQRQQICMESEEIRKLKEQLKTAKVNRERAAQVLERQFRE